MSKTSRSALLARLLPPSAQDFLRRRLVEAGGVALCLVGVLVILALLSYDPRDPSWNTAVTVGRAVTNLLGVSGAWMSDILLQVLGLGAYLFPLFFLVWGERILMRRGLSLVWLRIVMLLAGVTLATVLFAAIPAIPGWPLKQGHMGGMLGGVLFVLGVPLLLNSPALVVLLALSGASFALAVASGVALATWRVFVRAAAIWSWKHFVALYKPAPRPPALAEHRLPHWLDRIRVAVGGEEKPEAYPMAGSSASTTPAYAMPPAATGIDLRAEGGGSSNVRSTRPLPTPRKAPPKQQTLSFEPPEPGAPFALPPVDLLQFPVVVNRNDVTPDMLRQNAMMLMGVLGDFGVRGEIVKVNPGPVVTLYELEPAPGTKSSRIIGLADDIARSMSALSVRVAVVPGRNVIGIELPNKTREMVFLRELMSHDTFKSAQAKLALILGKDIGGGPVVADLARMPHLLVAGTTGSGKSVAINTMILSILYRMSPDKCRFIMVDPKMLELSVYEGIPHLLAPVVTEPKKAVVALKWAVREMEDRYRAMSKLGVRNIEGYNARLREAQIAGEVLTRRVQTGFDADTGKPIFEEQPIALTELPYIVVIVDEMADLMLVAGKDIEAAIQRLAQMARAAGIHLIMATQRPSVDVITGTIKANFPTRISFQVTSKIDSRTILGEQGAEQLLGQGDMLYMAGGGRITRVHGPFVSDQEVETVVKFLRSQGEPSYVDAVTEEVFDGDEGEGSGAGGGNNASDSGDELYDKAVDIVCRERKASTSFIQRHLRIGYNSAARLIERMEREGVVSQANHVGKREVLTRRLDEQEMADF